MRVFYDKSGNVSKRIVTQGGWVVTQVPTADGWWNISVERAT